MLSLLRDLVAHKGHANAAVLAVVRRSEPASADSELLDLLHHVLIANRFWICAVRRVPFVAASEARVPRAVEPLTAAFRATHDEELAWLGVAIDADCVATLTDVLIPGGACSVGDALTQVCLHSHGHRAQIAKMLRRHGVVPPQTDFILWLTERRPPDWDVCDAIMTTESEPTAPARPIPAVTCPLCGGANDCAAASSGTFDTPCWCREAAFSAELIARVPEAQRGLACLCRHCASAE